MAERKCKGGKPHFLKALCVSAGDFGATGMMCALSGQVYRYLYQLARRNVIGSASLARTSFGIAPGH